MHREDDSKFLLFIEPKKENKSTSPTVDEAVQIMEHALSKAKKGSSNYSRLNEEPNFNEGDGWMGEHITDCGVMSDNQEFLLENGMITNSLASFYLQWYRDVIPASEMKKVNELVTFYKTQ